MRNATEFNVYSGWRTWDDQRSGFLSDGADASVYTFMYTEWESSYDPEAFVEEDEPETFIVGPIEETEIRRTSDGNRIFWENESERCQVLQINGYVVRSCSGLLEIKGISTNIQGSLNIDGVDGVFPMNETSSGALLVQTQANGKKIILEL